MIHFIMLIHSSSETFSSMRELRLTYGFKGPERQDVLRKSMSANHDKVILEYTQIFFF